MIQIPRTDTNAETPASEVIFVTSISEQKIAHKKIPAEILDAVNDGFDAFIRLMEQFALWSHCRGIQGWHTGLAPAGYCITDDAALYLDHVLSDFQNAHTALYRAIIWRLLGVYPKPSRTWPRARAHSSNRGVYRGIGFYRANPAELTARCRADISDLSALADTGLRLLFEHVKLTAMEGE